MSESPLMIKSKEFALTVIKVCKELRNVKCESALISQFLRSGTSIGANVSESQQAQSRPDFISKLNITLKEAYETDYWLRLLHETSYLADDAFLSIYTDCQELERLLISIVKTSKE